MTQNPKYDNDAVNLGYLNKRLGQAEESINKNNNSISQIPKNYSIPPNPPYYKDSLLCYKNKIYKCNTTKLSGVFSWNDWTIVATDDTTLSDFINNTYELEKLEIQEQIDGKVQTYYQEMDPSNEWITDLEKAKHIGDYWYNTTNNTQWRYNRNTDTIPITYGWGQVNVPNSVFDLIDKKKSIYTIKPTSYKKDDLWIIEDTLSDEDLPTGTEDNPIAKGDWVFSVADSDTYNKEHWIKRDEDISLSYLEQHYYTIGDIDSSFEELERNTDSKITKAKEEISLNVSQTYTTIEEHNAAINDFDEQIGAINDTITTHETNISNLNVGVGKISASVESIESKTEELSVDIDGVKENIIPTSTVSGSNIHIEDASDKKMVNFEIEGKSEQKTRSGKNLFNKENNIVKSNVSPTKTVLDTGVRIVYNYSGGYPFALIEIGNLSDYLEKTMRIKTTGVPSSSNRFAVGFYIANDDYSTIQALGNSSYYYNEAEVLFEHTLENSYDSTYTKLLVGLRTASTTSTSDYVDFTNLIITSNNSNMDYEPYGVMPSPDYPSEIESVGYENLANFPENASLPRSESIETIIDFGKDITLSNFTLSFIMNNAKFTNANNAALVDFKKNDGTHQYRVSSAFGLLINTELNGKYSRNETNITFRYLNVYLGSTYFSGFIQGTCSILLTEGSQPHPYIPYGKYGIEVKTVGENLYNLNEGITTQYNTNGTLNTNQLYTLNNGVLSTPYTLEKDGRKFLKPILLKADTYTLNFDITNSLNTYSCFSVRDMTNLVDVKSTTRIASNEKHISYTFTLTEDTNISFSIQPYNDDGSIVSIANLMINQGNEKSYKPYQENISVILLDEPLRSLPNGVKDIAYIKNNKLYVDRKIGSVVLDGSKSLNKLQTLNNTITFQSDVLNNAKLNVANELNYRSDMFISDNNYSLDSEHFYVTNAGRVCLFINSNRLNGNTVDAWLSTHNTQVDYELAEPYTEKIGEVEIPSTFKGVNNITTTDELEPVMNIEYVRDTILSDYVEGQVSNAVAIQERKNAEFQITNEEIKSTVSAISTNLDGTKSSLKSVEEKITSQEKTIKIISKNIDSTTGNITEVTTTNGFTFNSNGLKIYIDENSYNTVIDNVGTYYKDGDAVINQTTKDGSILTNLSEKGQTKYSYNENDDYDFIEERIESDGEYAYATFYNGEE